MNMNMNEYEVLQEETTCIGLISSDSVIFAFLVLYYGEPD